MKTIITIYNLLVGTIGIAGMFNYILTAGANASLGGLVFIGFATSLISVVGTLTGVQMWQNAQNRKEAAYIRQLKRAKIIGDITNNTNN